MGIPKWEDMGAFGHIYPDDWASSPTTERRKHLIAIEVEEEASNIGPLVFASLNSIMDEAETMRALLRREGIKVTCEYRSTAGRYALKMEDNAHSMAQNLDQDHYLVVSPAEEPDYWSWSEGFDFEVEHGGDCTPEVRYDGLCPFEDMVHQAGSEAFGKPGDWPEPPFRKRVKFVSEHYPGGPWGAEEWDAWIEEDEPDEQSTEQ